MLQFAAVLKIVGLMLIVASTTLLPPILVDIYFNERTYPSFLITFLMILITGVLLWLSCRRASFGGCLRIREGISLVLFFWVSFSFLSAFPFLLSDSLNLTFVDAFFETVSGLTTTGATLLLGLDAMPKGILYYRQQLQWLGGIGIVVLAVAVLPQLGVRQVGFFSATSIGAGAEKLVPKLSQTALMLWKIYLVLTLCCMLFYWLAGMSGFDAIGHAFSTIAIGGFSTHDNSFGYFNSPIIESVGIFFMVLSGINFALHFNFLCNGKLVSYRKDSEFRAYFVLLFSLSFLVCIGLFSNYYYPDALQVIRHGVFQTVSMMTTTGFTTTAFSTWPTWLPLFLILIGFIGASTGSTGGGLKVIRVLMLFKVAAQEIKSFIHPRAFFRIRMNQKEVESQKISGVFGFLVLYFFVFIIILFLLSSSGLDWLSAFSATSATLNNLGPGLGMVAENYRLTSDFQKIILSISMLVGRWEILIFAVMFHREFWR